MIWVQASVDLMTNGLHGNLLSAITGWAPLILPLVCLLKSHIITDFTSGLRETHSIMHWGHLSRVFDFVPLFLSISCEQCAQIFYKRFKYPSLREAAHQYIRWRFMRAWSLWVDRCPGPKFPQKRIPSLSLSLFLSLSLSVPGWRRVSG